MRHISSDSSVKEEGFPEVEVLLATFNGELYLAEFLESLSCQDGVKIHLRVSDDGSTDRTLKIVESYKNRFESCLIFSGPRVGPSANFFSLINEASFDFIALADQDDIWFPEHLINSVRRLQMDKNPLSMTFCQVEETVKNSTRFKRVWPNISSSPELHEIFFQNFARGCTIVFKYDLAKLISTSSKEHAIMHDWWIYLVAKSCGSTIFGINPELKYRIHSNNAVGLGPKLTSRISNFFLNSRGGNWPPWIQLEQIQLQFQDTMLPQAKADIAWLMNIPHLQNQEKFSQIFFSARKLRRGLFPDLVIKFFLLFNNTKHFSK